MLNVTLKEIYIHLRVYIEKHIQIQAFVTFFFHPDIYSDIKYCASIYLKIIANHTKVNVSIIICFNRKILEFAINKYIQFHRHTRDYFRINFEARFCHD